MILAVTGGWGFLGHHFVAAIGAGARAPRAFEVLLPDVWEAAIAGQIARTGLLALNWTEPAM